MTSGFVSSFESMTALDGVGLRAMVFLHGCPLKCIMCSNPETWHGPKPAATTSDSIVQRIARVAGYIDGCTVSGGEPLAQPAFTAAIMKGVKDLGLSTCLDTSGQGNHHGWDTVLSLTDHALFCIKSLDARMYERITGGPHARALQFGDELLKRDIAHHLRYVLLPGYTDRPKDLTDLIAYCKHRGPALVAVELLPYHRLGVHKWAQLGLKYPLAGMDPPRPEAVDVVADALRSAGIRVLV